jgi:hypothetical protein
VGFHACRRISLRTMLQPTFVGLGFHHMFPTDVTAEVKCLTSDTRQQRYPGRQCGSKSALELHKADAYRHARRRSQPEDQAEAKSPHHAIAPRAGPHEAVAEALRANACEPEPATISSEA